MTNDMIIIGGFILFFISVGYFLPFMNEEFGHDAPEFAGADDVTYGDIFVSILSMTFWTFGSIPFTLDLLLFIPIRVIFWLTIARNIWIGGGG